MFDHIENQNTNSDDALSNYWEKFLPFLVLSGVPWDVLLVKTVPWQKKGWEALCLSVCKKN